MQQHADFLAGQELAEERGQHVLLAQNLLATLRNRELVQAAKDIAAEAGLEHRPAINGQRMVGIYRRSVMLASAALRDAGRRHGLRRCVLDDWEGTGTVDLKWIRASNESHGGSQRLTEKLTGFTATDHGLYFITDSKDQFLASGALIEQTV